MKKKPMKKSKIKSVVINDREIIAIDKLKNHPRNYRSHNDDQLAHIIASIKKHGIYKNIVVAKDDIVLAGHGVLKAAIQMGLTEIPIVRLNINSNHTEALKVLAGDNEISRLAEIDDRELSEILKLVNDREGLMGTGYDEMMLANLVMVTRPEGEIKDIDEAAEWVGMPDYVKSESEIKVVVNLKSEEDRIAFLELIGQPDADFTRLWWPPRERSDKKSLRFD